MVYEKLGLSQNAPPRSRASVRIRAFPNSVQFQLIPMRMGFSLDLAHIHKLAPTSVPKHDTLA